MSQILKLILQIASKFFYIFKVKKIEQNPEKPHLEKQPEAKPMQKLKLSKSGLDHLVEYEGIKLTPYLDSIKKPTIGIGNTFYEDGTAVTMNDPPITIERAYELANNVLKQFEEAVNTLVTVELTQNQFDALVCFVYNVGINNLKRSTLLRLLNEGKIDEAAKEFPKWNKAGGKEIAGLTRRRISEQRLFLS